MKWWHVCKFDRDKFGLAVPSGRCPVTFLRVRELFCKCGKKKPVTSTTPLEKERP